MKCCSKRAPILAACRICSTGIGERGRRNYFVASGWTSVSIMGFTVWNGKIVEIDVLRDPGRLSRLDLTVVKE
jgi:hypothetical protein